MMEMLQAFYFSETALCCFCGVCFLALGGLLSSPLGVKVVAGFSRHQLTGYILSAIVWLWVGVELYLRPVDLLAFVSPGKTLGIALLLIPASWVLLSNLLPVRALGGLFMLWPMPVILAVRSDPSLWRLVPVVVGYVHLIFGMIFVFHPWTLRVFCEAGVRRPQSIQLVGAGYVLIGILMFFTAFMLQPVAIV
jgi:hypothetical protein